MSRFSLIVDIERASEPPLEAPTPVSSAPLYRAPIFPGSGVPPFMLPAYRRRRNVGRTYR
jgi:hypothetical protein